MTNRRTLSENTLRQYAIQARINEERQQKREERAVRYMLRMAQLDAARADVANVLRRMGLQSE